MLRINRDTKEFLRLDSAAHWQDTNTSMKETKLTKHKILTFRALSIKDLKILLE
jgi:hypothetical protein